LTRAIGRRSRDGARDNRMGGRTDIGFRVASTVIPGLRVK
jgi:hypothetical protein